MGKRYPIVIAGLVFYITLLHWFIPVRFHMYHIVLRLLYLIPIVYAGLSGGKKHGLVASAAISVLLLAHFLSRQFFHPLFYMDNLASAATYLLVGVLSGSYRDSLAAKYTRSTATAYSRSDFGKSFLVYLDETPLGLHTVDWFVDCFGGRRDVKVTLLCITKGGGIADSANGEMGIRSQEVKENAETRLNSAKRKLLDAGIPEDRISSIVMSAETLPARPITDNILRELRDGSYDTVLVPRHNINKTQEFLMGDVALSLLRESMIPVVAVKMKADSNGIPK